MLLHPNQRRGVSLLPNALDERAPAGVHDPLQGILALLTHFHILTNVNMSLRFEKLLSRCNGPRECGGVGDNSKLNDERTQQCQLADSVLVVGISKEAVRRSILA